MSKIDSVVPAALRSWLFVEGGNETALAGAEESGADVLIQELEDFTPPALRSHAREISPDVVARWKAAGIVSAVRINPLGGDGMVDLSAVMRGAPDIIMLPKTVSPSDIVALAAHMTHLETVHGLTSGSTHIVPNVEGAAGLVQTFAICRASERVVACLVASEDMAADLGAERGPDGLELAYVRERFHVECVAAGVVSIDCPYTWTDDAGLEVDTSYARRLGYTAKSAVFPAHAGLINRILSPGMDEVAKAERIVAAFDAARKEGQARVELDGSLVEVPIYLNANRLLLRAKLFGSC